MNKRNLLNFALLFLIFLLFFQVFTRETGQGNETEQGDFTMLTTRNEFKQGRPVSLTLANNSEETINIPIECPGEPFRVFHVSGGKNTQREVHPELNCEQLRAEGSLADIMMPAHSETNLEYTYWSNALFKLPGRYYIEGDVTIGEVTRIIRSNEFIINERGAFGKFWMTAIYQPIYNVLMLFIKHAPGKNLAFAIIALTIALRILLLIPSQRAIVSQRKMQDIQPRLEKIRKKYAGNQEKIASETMAVWKEAKVNPLGSCLPILIQFPILIALFYVVQSGLNPDNSILLYPSLANFTFSDIDPFFLGMDLTKLNTFVLPLVVGGLQFGQMKLAEAKSKKKKKQGEEKPAGGNEMQMATKMMTYFMPIMIAVFTASIPAGVGVYWGTSTLFGIGQQLVANHSLKK
jgi:YidC/Oxa1 family membrane protein insertase